MAQSYVYKVKDKTGKILNGNIEGDSEAMVIGKLKQMGYTIVNVSSKAGAGAEINLGFLKKRVKSKDLTVFSRQFATMINSGLSLTKCLGILADQAENSTLAEIINTLQKDVEGGLSLSEAMGKNKIFPTIFINMVRAGEAGGVLDEVLLRVAEHFEKEAGLKAKIKSAMSYPIAMFSFSMLILFVMITFIVPMFVGMFEDLGGNLPLPTKILLFLSNFVRGFWWLMIAAIIGIVIGYKSWKSTETGRMTLDRLKLKLPVFGSLIRKISIAKFTRTLGTLVSSGVPILQALDITGDTAGNAVIEDAVKGTRSSIKEGETIAKPLEESHVFPPMVTQMIAVGEETGALDSMLTKIADFYDEEVANTVDALTSLLEPLMLVVMGLIIGGIIISLYMPMFGIINLIQ